MNRQCFAYNCVLHILSPVIAVFYLYRVLVSGKSRKSWRQQLGISFGVPPRTPGRPRVWVQAVSVGETVASVPVMKALKELLPEVELVLSTTTVTGQDVARKNVPEADYVVFYPLDFPFCVNRALDAVKPDVFVSMESEIWPNFMSAARRRGVEIAIVNGIVSDKTMRRTRHVRWLYHWALSQVGLLSMQSAQDKERVVELGALRERVKVQGNCKFDEPIPSLSPEQRAELRRKLRISASTPVFVAGSTNPGEDAPVIEALKIARKSHPDLVMVIAPRQIDRAAEICDLAAAAGFRVGRRSEPETLTGAEDVIVLDTLGELATVYSIAEAAFVGGSFIRKGGHNILQPIAHGKPVYFGPHTFKCRDLARMAREAGVGFEVADGEELGAEISRAVGNRPWLHEIESKAAALIDANKGASIRSAEAIARLIRQRVAA